jgi:small subunit ribosomal protein S8
MLTQVRNAIRADHRTVTVPFSKNKQEIAEILRRYRYIQKFVVVEEDEKKYIKILLNYTGEVNAIQGIARISRPGLRHYAGFKEMPKIENGLGIAIVSTSKGWLTDRECRREHIGGELICKVW